MNDSEDEPSRNPRRLASMAAGSTVISRGFIELHMSHGPEPTGVDGHKKSFTKSPGCRERRRISTNAQRDRRTAFSTNTQRAGSELELSNAYVEL